MKSISDLTENSGISELNFRPGAKGLRKLGVQKPPQLDQHRQQGLQQWLESLSLSAWTQLQSPDPSGSTSFLTLHVAWCGLQPGWPAEDSNSWRDKLHEVLGPPATGWRSVTERVDDDAREALGLGALGPGLLAVPAQRYKPSTLKPLVCHLCQHSPRAAAHARALSAELLEGSCDSLKL